MKARSPEFRTLSIAAAVACATAIFISAIAIGDRPAEQTDFERKDSKELDLSPMAAIRAGLVEMPRPRAPRGTPNWVPRAPGGIAGAGGSDVIVHNPQAVWFQSETTIAANGDTLVVGFNDARGFLAEPTSVSGYAYSFDGGQSWIDGGQLHTTGPADKIYGDPDVKSWTDGSQTHFVYSSLYKTAAGQRSLCVHVSSDGGLTWDGPRTVHPATDAVSHPDKEFIDIDPVTGRLYLAWTNAYYGEPDTMRICYSDDLGLSWSGMTEFLPGGFGAIPRTNSYSGLVYFAWKSDSGDLMFTRSVDYAEHWEAPRVLVSGIGDPEHPYGFDRGHGFPSMAVSPINGRVFIVYAARQNPPDFSDVYFISSWDAGQTFSSPVAINSNPGDDRGQMFPWICVDEVNGDLSVVWYDQIMGTGTSDITDVFHTHSPDNGLTWSCPAPLTDNRFHAEAGNTSGGPNLGDYIQAVSIDNTLYTAFGKTDSVSHRSFAPDTYIDISDSLPRQAPIALVSVRAEDYQCVDINHYWEPGEQVKVWVTIKNYSDCASSISGIHATLSSPTPGITFPAPLLVYEDLGGANSTVENEAFALVDIGTYVPCGTTAEFTINITSSEGDAVLRFSKPIGRLVALETLLGERFDYVTAPNLPAGWVSADATTGVVNDDWVTSTLYARSGPNAVSSSDPVHARFSELSSPAFVVPIDCKLLEVRFELTHDIPVGSSRSGPNGAFMRLLVGGEKYSAGAIASYFSSFYGWKIQGDEYPLQNQACWASSVTPDFTEVVMRFPDMAGETVNLLFDMRALWDDVENDGVFIDNILVRSLNYFCECTSISDVAGDLPPVFEIVSVSPNPFNPVTTVEFVLPEPRPVTAEVWSAAGALVKVLASDKPFGPGAHDIRWNGVNEAGHTVASGVYFIRIRALPDERVAKVVLLK